MNARSFYPGHEDGEKTHTADASNRCVRCGIDLTGRSDLRRSADPPPPGSLEALRQKARQASQGLLTKDVNPIADAMMNQRLHNPGPRIPIPSTSEQRVRSAIENAVSSEEIATIRKRTEQTIAIALFHTDPRVHAFLLLDPLNDDMLVMGQAMHALWQENKNGWRDDAVARASKMVEIIGAAQRRQGP